MELLLQRKEKLQSSSLKLWTCICDCNMHDLYSSFDLTALISNLQFFGWGFWSSPSAVGDLIKLDAVFFELGGNPFQASCPSGEWFGLSIQCTFVPWTNPLDFQILTTLSIPNIHSFLKEVDRFRVKDSNQYRKSCVMGNPGFLTNHLQTTKCQSIPQH